MRFRVCDVLQMVDFCLHLCKCDVYIFMYEEHGGSMVWHDSQIDLTMKENIVVVVDLWF